MKGVLEVKVMTVGKSYSAFGGFCHTEMILMKIYFRFIFLHFPIPKSYIHLWTCENNFLGSFIKGNNVIHTLIFSVHLACQDSKLLRISSPIPFLRWNTQGHKDMVELPQILILWIFKENC